MSFTYERDLPLSGAYNIRDLGGYPAGAASTQWRRVLRADALHRLDGDGVAALLDAGVRTVIDLRHATELEVAPNPFNGHAAVRYINISLFDNLKPPVAETDAEGNLTDALLDLYKMALAERKVEIAQVLSTIADAPAGAVMFHCTAGKDRTGVIAALLLSASGVAEEAIIADYALTAERIAPLVPEFLEDAGRRGIDVEAFRRLLGSEPETMRGFLVHLVQEYGDVYSYLDQLGLDADLRARLAMRLMADTTEAAT
jgi:protein-tyrosine phosphatase